MAMAWIQRRIHPAPNHPDYAIDSILAENIGAVASDPSGIPDVFEVRVRMSVFRLIHIDVTSHCFKAECVPSVAT